jgi:hypothetical protein
MTDSAPWPFYVPVESFGGDGDPPADGADHQKCNVRPADGAAAVGRELPPVARVRYFQAGGGPYADVVAQLNTMAAPELAAVVIEPRGLLAERERAFRGFLNSLNLVQQ